MTTPRSYFARPALVMARALLGDILVHETPEGSASGRIVEAEAYREDDPASHSYRRTARSEIMFGPAGYAYTYFSYGLHVCFNVVVGEVGHGAAVLIRALEPLEGIDLMRRRRGLDDPRKLCSGPAKLTEALAIEMTDYGADLTRGPLRVERGRDKDFRVVRAPRVGITKAAAKPWRFYIAGCPFISKR